MSKLVCLLLVLTPALAGADTALTRSTTWDCKKDPVVRITQGMTRITFKGECKTIAVGSGKNTLTIESVDTLDVGGAMNEITVGTVGTILLTGAKNVVHWTSAKSGDKPKVADTAVGNVVAHVAK